MDLATCERTVTLPLLLLLAPAARAQCWGWTDHLWDPPVHDIDEIPIYQPGKGRLEAFAGLQFELEGRIRGPIYGHSTAGAFGLPGGVATGVIDALSPAALDVEPVAGRFEVHDDPAPKGSRIVVIEAAPAPERDGANPEK